MKTLVFTDEELNLIARGLGLLPYHQVASLFGNIQAQITNAERQAANPLPEVPGVTE